MQTIHELSAELLPKEEDKERKVEDEYDLQEPSDAHPYKGSRTRREGAEDEDDENKNVMLFEPPPHDEERCER